MIKTVPVKHRMINKLVEFVLLPELPFIHDGGRYHIEISPLIYEANQWTGFYMIAASAMKELTLQLNFFSDRVLFKAPVIFLLHFSK